VPLLLSHRVRLSWVGYTSLSAPASDSQGGALLWTYFTYGIGGLHDKALERHIRGFDSRM
jgi:hypothetical protein